ncbi:MAG: Ig-like domain-containing protein [Bacilli bacterium]|nr:Ig-like domain-containing protein [Bacilli bacterium]
MKMKNPLMLLALCIGSLSLSGCAYIEEFLKNFQQGEEGGETETDYYKSAVITPANPTVEIGGHISFTAELYPADAKESGIVWTIDDPLVGQLDDNGSFDALTIGSTYVNVKGKESGNLLGRTKVTVTLDGGGSGGDIVEVSEKTTLESRYKTLSNNTVYSNVAYCDTLGDINIIVIPVWLNDSSNFISTSKKSSVRNDIQKAYFGTDGDTGWKSVKTYYEEESNGKFSLTGVVSDWYSVNYNHDDPEICSPTDNITGQIVKDATTWFFNNNSYSRSEFDADKDGYIDAVMLIYAAPDYGALGDDSKSNLWAYAFYCQNGYAANKNNPNPNAYFWASYDFMYGANAYTRTGKSTYQSGDTLHCTIDAHTYIHEMGHVLGLDDYYDYSDYKYTPAGNFSMQDHNVGGHDPFSVMAYGWADPYVVTGDSEVTIGTFQETHDVILISSKWNTYNSPFDEYILLELYSNTGLNEFDCDYMYNGSTQYAGVKKVGIRMWHVDARLLYAYNSGGEMCVDSEHMTTNPNKGYVATAWSNTYENDDGRGTLIADENSKFYDYNLLQLIRNNKTETYHPTERFMASDLFTNGSYNLYDYDSQFVENNTLNNGETLDWNISIEITGSGANSQAKVTIDKL